MRLVFIVLTVWFQVGIINALVINEILSNPVGDDSGREWVELYNDGTEAVDLSTLTLSIKGGSFIAVVPIQGGTVLGPGEYAVVSSIISASSPVSKFLDTSTGYPSYTGILLRVASSVSFVNTGTTSLDIRLNGSIVDSLSYTPAGEGKTLSKVSGVFVSGIPTPGSLNQESQTTTSSSVSGSQIIVAQTSPPSPDIVLYLPETRLVVAGAETEFSVYGANKDGKILENLSAVWSFGDGGQAVGTSTKYAYVYPGRYIARVDAGNSFIRGIGTTNITVVSPEIFIHQFGIGKYGAYVDIENPNEYDLDVSQWHLVIGYSHYIFPKNTILAKKSITRIAGKAMGFEHASPKDGESITIMFPSLEPVTTFLSNQATSSTNLTAEEHMPRTIQEQTRITIAKQKNALSKMESSSFATKTPTVASIAKTRDTRLVTWFRALFARQ